MRGRTGPVVSSRVNTSLSTWAYACAMQEHPRQIRGFTMIELSIVLVIIGLLIAGVIVGRDLIEMARLRKLASEIAEYETSVNAFRLKYNAWPGDMADATQIWPTATNGNGDSMVYWGLTSGPEMFYFWQHLTLAGMIKSQNNGSYNNHTEPGVNVPASFYKPKLGYAAYYYDPASGWGTHVREGNYIYFIYDDGSPWGTAEGAFNAQEIAAVDRKIDDGRPLTGRFVGDIRYWPCVDTVNNEWFHYTEYVTCTGLYHL